MPTPPFLRAGRLLAIVAAVALVACGGGGDEDDTAQPSGLVPTPPALGPTLAAAATSLRPFAPGATWVYNGNTNGSPYTNTVTQTAATLGVDEHFTNLLNAGAASVQVAVLNGNVVQPEPVDIDGDGVVDLANAIELRSPVRQGDQIVYFDQRLVEAFDDVDGDGRRESFDLAVYSQVIGRETVDLGGALPHVQGVRVDNVTKGRLVLSGGGATQPTLTATQSTWYAEDYGVVRRRIDQPDDTGIGRVVSVETLVSVSGL
ncbi:hypothetical protein [Ideonella sp.]|uniref:hypothetical protein n=1 Tax=Ideonella sp. TaxID=1929293 RepID=UPI0035B173EA